MFYQVNFDSSLILRTVKRPRGSNNRLIPYYECKCSTVGCSILTYRDVNKYLKWSGYCRPCSNRIKLAKARTVPNPADGRPYEALYNNLVKHAIARKKQITLTFEEFTEFTEHKTCHYCPNEIKWTVRNLTLNGSKYNLDRKNNDLGYTKENCVPCCWTCNNARSDLFSYEDWHGMTKYLREKK